jgi:hypothetical protein
MRSARSVSNCDACGSVRDISIAALGATLTSATMPERRTIGGARGDHERDGAVCLRRMVSIRDGGPLAVGRRRPHLDAGVGPAAPTDRLNQALSGP